MTDAIAGVPGKNRSATRAARRQQLINATIDSIAERGFSGTTLDKVTKGANLSHGVVNFHFESKEDLYDETLGFLAQEHYRLWHGSMKQAGPEPDRQLAAIVEADFDRKVCSSKKLAVWFAFWGQVKYRPNYIEIHNRYDDERFAEIKRLCSEIIERGEYESLEPASVARCIEALIDGLWLNLLLYPTSANRTRSRDDCFTFLNEMFPKHFPPRRPDNDPTVLCPRPGSPRMER